MGNKMWSTFHYYTMKRHKLLTNSTTRMKLGNTVTKGKKADRQNYMLHNPTPIKYILKDKTEETETRLSVVWGWGRRRD